VLRELCVGGVGVEEGVGLLRLAVLEAFGCESEILVELGGFLLDDGWLGHFRRLACSWRT
jgi:hypothetical protein